MPRVASFNFFFLVLFWSGHLIYWPSLTCRKLKNWRCPSKTSHGSDARWLLWINRLKHFPFFILIKMGICMSGGLEREASCQTADCSSSCKMLTQMFGKSFFFSFCLHWNLPLRLETGRKCVRKHLAPNYSAKRERGKTSGFLFYKQDHSQGQDITKQCQRMRLNP